MSKTIFIAEDNPINLKLVKDILEAKGYNTLEAYDGKESLKKIIEKFKIIDLILMDLQMPELNGLDAVLELKKNPDTAKIPVIILSAHAMESDIQKAKELGVDDYITKPINLVEFMTKVDKFIL